MKFIGIENHQINLNFMNRNSKYVAPTPNKQLLSVACSLVIQKVVSSPRTELVQSGAGPEMVRGGAGRGRSWSGAELVRGALILIWTKKEIINETSKQKLVRTGVSTADMWFNEVLMLAFIKCGVIRHRIN